MSYDAIKWHSKIAKDFDSKYLNNNNFKERFSVLIKYIDKYASCDAVCLDLGCGSGIFSTYMSSRNKEVISVDGSQDMLDILHLNINKHNLKNIHTINMNISNLNQLGLDNIDLVFCSSVLEYIDDIDKVFMSINKLLKNDGVLIFSIPNRKSIYRKIEKIIYTLIGIPKYYQHVKTISDIKDIRNSLNNYGFDLVGHEYFAKTPIISKIFRQFSLEKYSDNLLLVIASKNTHETNSPKS